MSPIIAAALVTALAVVAAARAYLSPARAVAWAFLMDVAAAFEYSSGGLVLPLPIARLAAVLVVGAALLGIIRGKSAGTRLRPMPGITVSPVMLSVLALLLYAVTSAAWAEDSAIAFGEWQRQAPYLVIAAVSVIAFVRTSEDVREVLRDVTCLGAVLLVVVVALANWGVRGLMIGPAEAAYPFSGGAEGVGALPVATLAAIVAIGVSFSRARSLAMSAVQITGVLACIALILQTESRGQLAAVLIILVLTVVRGVRLDGTKALRVTGLSALAAAMLLFVLDQPLGAIVQDTRWASNRLESGIQQRAEFSGKLLDEYASQGTVGYLFGLGSCTSMSPTSNGVYPHNLAVEIACELGLTGSLLAVGVLLSVILSVRRRGWLAGGELNLHLLSMAALFVMLSLKQGNVPGSHGLWASLLLVGARFEKSGDANG